MKEKKQYIGLKLMIKFKEEEIVPIGTALINKKSFEVTHVWNIMNTKIILDNIKNNESQRIWDKLIGEII